MKLIINADDFGLSEGVNKGIFHGMENGLITSTSAIVSGKYFKEGAKEALEKGITSMGLHMLLTNGKPLSHPDRISTLIDENGCFYSRKEFLEKEIDYGQVREELEEQIQLFLSTGLELDHIDTHHGFMNKDDTMRSLIQELASKYQVPLRNEGNLNNNIRKVDTVYFNHGTPYHTIEDVLHFLSTRSENEIVEIGCHPGYNDEFLESISSLNAYRENDLAVMCSEELKAFVKENNIQMISYREL